MGMVSDGPRPKKIIKATHHFLAEKARETIILFSWPYILILPTYIILQVIIKHLVLVWCNAG